MLIPPSAAADGISSRGTSWGWIACHAGLDSAVVMPSPNVSRITTEGDASPAAVSSVSSDTTRIAATCAPSRNRRRSKMSASTPAGSDTNSTGSRPAACAKAVSTVAFGWWMSIHWAPTFCIHVPMLETSCAIHSHR